MKGKKLSFPFICFFESGLFNGLRPIQIKKIAPINFADLVKRATPRAGLRLAAAQSGKPRICRLQPECGRRNVKLRQGLGGEANDGGFMETAGL
jgi:hypothetical protein